MNEQERVIYNNKIRVTHNSREFKWNYKTSSQKRQSTRNLWAESYGLKRSCSSPGAAHNIVSPMKGYLLLRLSVLPEQQESSNSQKTGNNSGNSTNQNQWH
ncbi:hypothetical protein O9992_22000 [Vibrio lentus]|nr:hypothetical protein [Vibrio lentus]